jgi:hypothetical protein
MFAENCLLLAATLLNGKPKTANPFRDICPTCSGKISPFCYN